MKKNYSWKILLGAVIIITVFLFTKNCQAKTLVNQVSQQNTEITVKIVFDFVGQDARKNADELIKTWQEGMNKIWNNKYCAKMYTLNSSDITYIFDLQKVENGRQCADYPDFHCIAVVSSEKNSRGNIADVKMVLPNTEQNSVGEWSIITSAKIAAHEVGHLMGLSDEYHYEYINGEKIWTSDNYEENKEKSIMAQTWGNVGIFSKEINEILQKAGVV